MHGRQLVGSKSEYYKLERMSLPLYATSQKPEQDITMKEKNHFFHITFHVSFPQIRLEFIIHKFYNDFG